MLSKCTINFSFELSFSTRKLAFANSGLHSIIIHENGSTRDGHYNNNSASRLRDENDELRIIYFKKYVFESEIAKIMLKQSVIEEENVLCPVLNFLVDLRDSHTS